MKRADFTKFKKIAFVYNRNSGKQIFASMMSRVNEVYKLLHSRFGQDRVEMWDVRKFDELEGMAERIVADRVDWVVIAGGDGTIRSLIEKIADRGHRPYFSVFPAGTVNLIAKELLVPEEPEKWLRRVGKGLINPVYFGRTNGRLFLTVTGIGYDSLIVDAVTETAKKLLSKFAYVWQSAEMLRKEIILKDWHYEFKVRLDGGEWLKASTVFVCKSRYYAGRCMLFDDAKLSNDYFNVALFFGCSSTDFMRYSVRIGMGAIKGDKTIRIAKARKVEISCNVPDFPAELDGDVVTVAPLTIEMDGEPLLFLA